MTADGGAEVYLSGTVVALPRTGSIPVGVILSRGEIREGDNRKPGDFSSGKFSHLSPYFIHPTAAFHDDHKEISAVGKEVRVGPEGKRGLEEKACTARGGRRWRVSASRKSFSGAASRAFVLLEFQNKQKWILLARLPLYPATDG